MTIAREETVWLPRPAAIWPVEDETGLDARDHRSLEPGALATTAKPAANRARRGRHRVPARWSHRLAVAAAVFGIAAVTFGSGLTLGQTWARDGGQSIARQLDTWRTEVRDTLLGV